jgi:hypothetical protein
MTSSGLAGPRSRRSVRNAVRHPQTRRRQTDERGLGALLVMPQAARTGSAGEPLVVAKRGMIVRRIWH